MTMQWKKKIDLKEYFRIYVDVVTSYDSLIN